MHIMAYIFLFLYPDVSVLSNLPYLIFLDLSYNKLTTILDFQPPKNLLVSALDYHITCNGLFALLCVYQEVNYSHNEIEEICDLSVHHSLTRLTLDCIYTNNVHVNACNAHSKLNILRKAQYIPPHISTSAGTPHTSMYLSQFVCVVVNFVNGNIVLSLLEYSFLTCSHLFRQPDH